jgi:hypothetical protein
MITSQSISAIINYESDINDGDGNYLWDMSVFDNDNS